jgi:adenine-specific DNA-methyltransferase
MDYLILQGDARRIPLPDDSVDAIMTDPPYGIGYDNRDQSPGGKTSARKSATKVDWETIPGDEAPDGAWLAEAFRVMKNGAALYLCTRWDVEPEWRHLIVAAGFRLKQRLTWHKRAGGKGDHEGTWAPTCEDVLFATKGRHRLNRRPSALLDIGCVPTWKYRHHPHQKPVALPGAMIEASTRPGNVVLDPFAGSGTTLMACLKAGRRGIGIEIDPRFLPACRRRIAAAATPLFDGVAP